ncbi:MAG TPA: FkbM family methyltransferase [Candidatus Binataceae bacterium]|nr:FkbM family methyltransferase [Candidatus Binataceae bacterium]
MTAAEWSFGKYYALRMLVSMIAWFDNWREVWLSYRSGAAIPPLRFRRGFVLHHRPEDQVLLQFFEVFRDKSYRRYITEPRFGTMVDIGANIGAVTLDWMTRFLEIRVQAYEPHPATFAMLRANIEANGLTPRTVIYPEAVGGRTGMTGLRAGGLSMETTAYGIGATAHALNEFSVPMVALDTVIERCASDGPIGLVKIDAEGAEADILEGAHPETLKEIRQFVIEYHDGLSPNALARCERVLAGAGFRCATPSARPAQGLLYAWRDGARA